MPSVYPWISKSYGGKAWRELFFVDCAVYGKKNNDPYMDLSEILERKVHELKGIKTLISQNHYNEGTFWNIYNRELHSKVKQQMDPENLFGNLYAKFHPHRKR